jgi:hypothetical protein
MRRAFPKNAQDADALRERTLANLPVQNFDVLKMLFEEHHRQLKAKRDKIHSITEKTSAFLGLVAGWTLTSQSVAMSVQIRWLVAGFVVVVASSAMSMQYTNHRAYMSVASVLAKLNERIGLYHVGQYIESSSIYPPNWRNFGQEWILKGVLAHWLTITSIAAFCCAAVFLRK